MIKPFKFDRLMISEDVVSFYFQDRHVALLTIPRAGVVYASGSIDIETDPVTLDLPSLPKLDRSPQT